METRMGQKTKEDMETPRHKDGTKTIEDMETRMGQKPKKIWRLPNTRMGQNTKEDMETPRHKDGTKYQRRYGDSQTQ